MPLLKMSFFSETLGRVCDVNIVLPQRRADNQNAERPPFPVMYLLHGLSDNQDAWLRWSSIERYVQDKNLAVIMPATDRGFYTDTTYGNRYFTYISEELPDICRRYFPLSDKREDTFAAGLSMGGYGALKLGLRQAERFSFIAAMSSALMSKIMFDDWVLRHDGNSDFVKEMRGIFGDTFKPEDDMFDLLVSGAKAKTKPRLFICCGKDDELYKINAAFCKKASALGYNADWREHDGYGHEWAYWDKMIEEVIETLPDSTK